MGEGVGVGGGGGGRGWFWERGWGGGAVIQGIKTLGWWFIEIKDDGGVKSKGKSLLIEKEE